MTSLKFPFPSTLSLYPLASFIFPRSAPTVFLLSTSFLFLFSQDSASFRITGRSTIQSPEWRVRSVRGYAAIRRTTATNEQWTFWLANPNIGSTSESLGQPPTANACREQRISTKAARWRWRRIRRAEERGQQVVELPHVPVWIEVSIMNRNEHVTTCEYALPHVYLPILISHFALSSTQNRSMYFESQDLITSCISRLHRKAPWTSRIIVPPTYPFHFFRLFYIITLVRALLYVVIT